MPKTERMNFDTGRFVIGRGPEGLKNALKLSKTVRGTGGTEQPLRLPDATWEDLAALAKQRKTTVDRLIRRIIAEHLYTQTWAERQAANKRRRSSANS